MNTDRTRTPPETCPACGADVPPTALACPECGADHETVWNEDEAVYDGVDLPDGEFDYDDFVRREFPDGGARRGMGARAWLILALAAAALAAAVFVWRAW